jgi:hypothetical protein
MHSAICGFVHSPFDAIIDRSSSPGSTRAIDTSIHPASHQSMATSVKEKDTRQTVARIIVIKCIKDKYQR